MKTNMKTTMKMAIVALAVMLTLSACDLLTGLFAGALGPEARVTKFFDDLNNDSSETHLNFSSESTTNYKSMAEDPDYFANTAAFNNPPYTMVPTFDEDTNTVTATGTDASGAVSYQFKMVEEGFGWLIDDVLDSEGSVLIRQLY